MQEKLEKHISSKIQYRIQIKYFPIFYQVKIWINQGKLEINVGYLKGHGQVFC